MISPQQTGALREAQLEWAARPVNDRLRFVRKLRALIASEAESLAASSADARSRPVVESLTAEVLPLAEACRFLGKNAAHILATKRFGRSGRPVWLSGVCSEVRREPVGVIFIIGPGNYPLFLPGVQLIQALVAGNGVIIKPGVGGMAAAEKLIELIDRSGVDRSLILLLPEAIQSVRYAIATGPDKVIFTGSAEVGEKIAMMLCQPPIPSVMELSGQDGVIVRADADLELLAKALRFALDLNDGATCMIPQRLFIHRSLLTGFQGRFGESHLPVMLFDTDAEAADLLNDCPFALGASIFSRNGKAALVLAGKLQTGLVTINDIIVSSADARLPFGGRRRSGHGTTRGAEGLLEMTVAKAVTVSHGRFRPAYQPVTPLTMKMLLNYTRMAHGTGLRQRFGSLFSKSKTIS